MTRVTTARPLPVTNMGCLPRTAMGRDPHAPAGRRACRGIVRINPALGIGNFESWAWFDGVLGSGYLQGGRISSPGMSATQPATRTWPGGVPLPRSEAPAERRTLPSS